MLPFGWPVGNSGLHAVVAGVLDADVMLSMCGPLCNAESGCQVRDVFFAAADPTGIGAEFCSAQAVAFGLQRVLQCAAPLLFPCNASCNLQGALLSAFGRLCNVNGAF